MMSSSLSSTPLSSSLVGRLQQEEHQQEERLMAERQSPSETTTTSTSASTTATRSRRHRDEPLKQRSSRLSLGRDVGLDRSRRVLHKHMTVTEVIEVDPLFEGELSKYRQATEWLSSLVFDVLLLVSEAFFNVWLATVLKSNFPTAFWLVLVSLLTPSMANLMVWSRMASSYSRIRASFMALVVTCGLPSPLFVYIWHLYLCLFAHQSECQRSRIVANTFRMIQACTSSLPLLLLNLYVLMDTLKVGDGNDALDLGQLANYLAHENNARIHCLAALASFLNLLRSSSLFNERTTFTLLFTLVGYPFLLFTLLSRVTAMAIIVAFLDSQWVALLVISLMLANLGLYLVTRKRGVVGAVSGSLVLSSSNSNRTTQWETSSGTNTSATSSEPDVELKCCGITKTNNPEDMDDMDVVVGTKHKQTVATASSTTSWPVEDNDFCYTLPRHLLFSLASIVVPCGYTNDCRSHHPRIRGGRFIVFNYLLNMFMLGLVLGLTIFYHIPNTVHGVSLPQPSLKVEVPSSKVVVQAGGLDVALNLPNTKLDLGSMPSFAATLNLESNDSKYAVLVPFVLALINFPFVVMRAAMMELDCVIARKKDIRPMAINELGEPRSMVRPRSTLNRSLLDTVQENNEHRGLRARVCITVTCSMCGMCVFTLLTILTIAFTLLQLQ